MPNIRKDDDVTTPASKMIETTATIESGQDSS